jgi:lipid-binding SYLF domain-containing protein
MCRIRFASILAAVMAAGVVGVSITGCDTAPKSENQVDVLSRSRSTKAWFQTHVTGLSGQIDRSAAYIVFPDVAQWGIVFGGGSFGRGVLFDSKGNQLGWAAINNASVGLQAGVQGFRMLMVIETQAELQRFKEGKWNGSASGVAVFEDNAAVGVSPFQQGLAVYQGANSGLMAGVNVGLNNIRFEALGG